MQVRAVAMFGRWRGPGDGPALSGRAAASVVVNGRAHRLCGGDSDLCRPRRARGRDSASASGRSPPAIARRLVTVAPSDPDMYRGNLEETPTLDYGNLSLVGLPDDISRRGVDSRRRARMIHEYVARTTTPLYSLTETRPASVTERKGAGSCSQRFALVEAIARRVGIPTRVEGLAIRGTFWARDSRSFVVCCQEG